jgi:tetraacyldisaccharide 4'-kinase
MQTSPRNTWRILLYPLSLMYGFIIYFRNLLFDYQLISSEEFDMPVISVGNITVGGTGKTPHVEYLIRLLKDEFNVASLSRGYKRKTRQYILADQNSTIDEIGDESLQIKSKYPDINVAVDRKRVNGIKKLMKEIPDLDVILLDDAYQHRHVKPGLSILLIDFNRPISTDLLLPAGMLREQSFEKRRAHIILITKCPDRIKPIERRLIFKDLKLYPFQNLYFTKLHDKDPVQVFPDMDPSLLRQEIKDIKPHILMISGIANPRSFKKYIRNYSTKITELIFPDHYSYKKKDIQHILQTFQEIEGENKMIMTTEKDAMRLKKFPEIDPSVKTKMYYIPIVIDFLNEDTENFNHHILNYVRHNKRDGILHKR